MSSDIAISVKNLTKTYRLFDHPGDRIKQALTFGRMKFHREFTALKDVSFEVKKGETVGIIGRNGSGKSTLLQLICGILKPTSGSVTVNGRISALLELGSGFSPEFTGRENLYFQGAIMGFSKADMDGRVEDIVAFADIGEFIDQPVRTYSSGMFVRLAFATAVHSEPDVLVIDEALAVGDIDFQKKSFAYMNQILQAREIAVVLVSHDLRQIQRFCSKAMYLDKGICRLYGDSQSTCQKYYEETFTVHTDGFYLSNRSIVASSGEMELLEVSILDSAGHTITEITSGQSLQICFSIQLNTDLPAPEFIAGTHSEDAVYLSSASTTEYPTRPDLTAGQHDIVYKIEHFPLAPGTYYARLNVRDQNFRVLYEGIFLKPFKVKPDVNGATRPTRLLNLNTLMIIDGQNLSHSDWEYVP
ncbi:MAG TPA: ABC transporter ATP-binding protein [Methylophilaceae bacterium]|nr:ABC transporter ATP-binding protein [Methylophilaceae bacterium]